MPKRWGMLLLLVLGAACSDPDCPEGTKLSESKSRCVPVDAGADASEHTRDSGTDASSLDAAPADARIGADASTDGGNTDAATLDGGHDAGQVPCSSSADCLSPTASHCSSATDTCVGCSSDAECDHLSATPECDEDEHRCGACTPDTEATRCGAKACNPITLECTPTDRNSLTLCEECAADSECEPFVDGGAAVEVDCVPLSYEGIERGTYCIPRRHATEGCIAVGLSTVVESTSVNGLTTNRCHVDEALTTCEAVRDHEAGTPCTASTEMAVCGSGTLHDGLCRDGKCTYRCDEHTDCQNWCVTSDDPAYCCVVCL